MGCIYCDFNGYCQMIEHDEDGNISEDSIDTGAMGVSDKFDGDGKAICVVEDDPDPSYSCEYYESNDSNEEEDDDWVEE